MLAVVTVDENQSSNVGQDESPSRSRPATKVYKRREINRSNRSPEPKRPRRDDTVRYCNLCELICVAVYLCFGKSSYYLS